MKIIRFVSRRVEIMRSDTYIKIGYLATEAGRRERQRHVTVYYCYLGLSYRILSVFVYISGVSLVDDLAITVNCYFIFFFPTFFIIISSVLRLVL
jgi:hypothetical protein